GDDSMQNAAVLPEQDAACRRNSRIGDHRHRLRPRLHRSRRFDASSPGCRTLLGMFIIDMLRSENEERVAISCGDVDVFANHQLVSESAAVLVEEITHDRLRGVDENEKATAVRRDCKAPSGIWEIG